MSCPHSLTGSPSQCSQCIGVQPKRVTQDGDLVFVDGSLVRSIAPGIEPNAHQPRKQRMNRGRK